ncbi:hypothetical protein WJ85_17350 [Burkholderia ubonensis]|nr:hypothetical protein WJ85_17350 [Burkholderia ubonensis]
MTDERRPQNRDEINVTMANGSRDDTPRAARASEILALIESAQQPSGEVTDNDVAKLKRFAGLVLKDHRNGGYPGDVPGEVIQSYAEQCGLIEERQMTTPCSEMCSCVDFGEFPTTCFFNTDLGKSVIDAARAQGDSHE